MANDCFVCSAPIVGMVSEVADGTLMRPRTAHGDCATAFVTGDREATQAARVAACAAGCHRYPGRWQANPTDPCGDARYWDCAHGCGHRQTHPGYGSGRAAADTAGALAQGGA